jgi:hypothetical protein
MGVHSQNAEQSEQDSMQHFRRIYLVKIQGMTRETASPAASDVSPSFRSPRTRKGAAVAAAKPIAISRPIKQPIPLRVVDEVDKRQSVKMFNAGWILPENQKQGGRTLV